MEKPLRYLSLDIMKGAGILYLLFLHQLIWVVVYGDTGGFRYAAADVLCRYVSWFHFLGFQIPLLAGMTFFLSLRAKSFGWIALGQRVLFLMIVGFLMNFLAWGLEAAFDWDVLQFIALSMVISFPVLKRLPGAKGLLLLTGAGAAALFFSDRFPFFPLRDSYLYAVVFGNLEGAHYWPLCPWFSIFAAGLLAGYLLSFNSRSKLAALGYSGLVLFLTSLGLGRFFPAYTPDLIWGPVLFKPHALFVIGIIGIGFLSVALLSWALERFELWRQSLEKSFLVYFGQGILWIYVLSTVIGYRLTSGIVSSMTLNYGQALVVMFIFFIGQLALAYFVGSLVHHKKFIQYRSSGKE